MIGLFFFLYLISLLINIILVNTLYGINSIDYYDNNNSNFALLLIFVPILNIIATIVIFTYLIYKSLIYLFKIIRL